MTTDEVKDLTEKILKSGIFRFKANPVIQFVSEKNFHGEDAYMIRIMWGINENGDQMEYGGEGIEFFVMKSAKDIEDEIVLKIDKELGGIYYYSKELYYHIIH